MVATHVSSGKEFMRELARIIVCICRIVPGGVLCFLSSYKTMENLHSTLVSREFSSDLQSKKVESFAVLLKKCIMYEIEVYQNISNLIKNHKHQKRHLGAWFIC